MHSLRDYQPLKAMCHNDPRPQHLLVVTRPIYSAAAQYDDDR